jgi:hypothetical protein
MIEFAALGLALLALADRVWRSRKAHRPRAVRLLGHYDATRRLEARREAARNRFGADAVVICRNGHTIVGGTWCGVCAGDELERPAHAHSAVVRIGDMWLCENTGKVWNFCGCPACRRVWVGELSVGGDAVHFAPPKRTE